MIMIIIVILRIIIRSNLFNCKVCYTTNERWWYLNIFVLILKQYVEDVTIKYLLLFEICEREICEKFVYKHSETIEYAKNEPTF